MTMPHHRFLRLTLGGACSYSSTSLVWMMLNTFLPFLNSSTPVIESSAGMPARSGSKGGLAGAFFAGRAPVVFLCLDRANASSVFYSRTRFRVF